MRTSSWLPRLLALSILAPACGAEAPAPMSDTDNPFTTPVADDGKEDTAYVNPDGIEVEVDLEGDVEGPSYSLPDGPAVLGQYALTYLRKKGQFYLESLAEDSTSDQRVEWRVDGSWITAEAARTADPAKLGHFRLRGINAVLLLEARENARLGKVFTAKVPLDPTTVMAKAKETCADDDHHITLGQGVYWYRWDADRADCKLETQDLSVTVSKVLPKGPTTYPEYDRLVADKKLTVVVLFGQIGDTLDDSDPGMRGAAQMQRWLEGAGFKKANGPVGQRMTKVVGGTAVEIDLYSPKEFSGLSDYAHFGNFEKAIAEHEIVVYDGHSMLGASDYWARPKYPAGYQIFLYGGCLGYEYYVRPILAGKGGWQNVDILSSVIEVSAGANEFAAPLLAKMIWALDHGYRASWNTLLITVRKSVGDSTFGVSGVRDNCFTPTGTRCR